MSNDNTRVLTRLLKQFEKMLVAQPSDQDTTFLNTIYYRAGELAIGLESKKRSMEAGRKSYQFEIRDRLMEEQEMSRTAAEAEARSSDEYMAYLSELDDLTVAAEQAALVRDAAKQRAWLVLEERKWARRSTDPSEAEG